jgi:hypothetical protein
MISVIVSTITVVEILLAHPADASGGSLHVIRIILMHKSNAGVLARVSAALMLITCDELLGL